MKEDYWVTSKMAKYWDEIYIQVFDYESEVEKLDSIFKKYKVNSVLDLGCGTGEHCIRLALLCYKCYGVDINQNLFKIAKSKAIRYKTSASIIKMDYLNLNLSKLNEIAGTTKFNAVLMLNMSHPKNRLYYVLKNIKKLITSEQGVFVFNFIDHESKGFPIFSYEVGKQVIRFNSFYDIDNERKEWHMVWFFVEDKGTSIEVVKTYLYKYSQKDIEKILSETGFKIEFIDNDNWVVAKANVNKGG